MSSGRIGVTGAAGFVGGHLLHHLQYTGLEIVCILRPNRDPAPFRLRGVETRFADLARPAACRGAFDEIDVLVHLSGMGQVAGLVPMLEEVGLRRGVFVGSTGVHTRLASPSAEAKRRGEDALARSSLAWTIVRPTMIYGGPGDRNMARLLGLIRRIGIVPVPGGGATMQQPVHVDDLVSTIVAALAARESIGRAYDVGGPEALTLRTLIDQAARSLGRRARILPLPIAASAHAVELVRRTGAPFPIRVEQILRLAESKAVAIGDAIRDLGHRPRPFHEGIQQEAVALGLISRRL
ncbi:MAG: NAD-dependent epimerase/dehydratase family protein [Acidimicrobiales bacterium]